MKGITNDYVPENESEKILQQSAKEKTDEIRHTRNTTKNNV
tara:strand:+ start:197 stop:319 length:123 start_codon:yes stop_codon:yes gene_type:complete